jgi:hypothetical protein
MTTYTLTPLQSHLADKLIRAYDWQRSRSGTVDHAVTTYGPPAVGGSPAKVTGTLCGLANYYPATPRGVRCDNCLERIYAAARRRAKDSEKRYRVTRTVVETVEVRADDEDAAEQAAAELPVARWTRDIKDLSVDEQVAPTPLGDYELTTS